MNNPYTEGSTNHTAFKLGYKITLQTMVATILKNKVKENEREELEAAYALGSRAAMSEILNDLLYKGRDEDEEANAGRAEEDPAEVSGD